MFLFLAYYKNLKTYLERTHILMPYKSPREACRYFFKKTQFINLIDLFFQWLETELNYANISTNKKTKTVFRFLTIISRVFNSDRTACRRYKFNFISALCKNFSRNFRNVFY